MFNNAIGIQMSITYLVPLIVFAGGILFVFDRMDESVMEVDGG